MAKSPIVTSVEVNEIEYEIADVTTEPIIGIPIYEKGSKITTTARVLRINTDAGITGEYFGGNAVEYAAIPGLAKMMIGKNALDRELFYNDFKQALRQQASMGRSQIDIALWDIAGKLLDVPVHQLLGTYRKEFPCYASTYIADFDPDGLSSAEAMADFAEQCFELGYPAFKIHPWMGQPLKKQIEMVAAVGKRMAGKMDLMLDPVCTYETFGDAVKVGKVCDEWGYYWYEDPFRDSGVSAFAHKKLREIINTPILQTEHIRGLEQHVDFVLSGGTDFVRGDPDYDGGITGLMKLAHATEGLGLDLEVHVAGPDRRQTMAAMRNSNFYEMGLLHPKHPGMKPPVYQGGYVDNLTAIDENGKVSVPDGPGLGVPLDWDYINAHTTDHAVYS
ncbi:MAG: mandelate racemase [Chloroflexi bacterium]|nr:mandelate racemase [Chloroflexota bacterium]